jgi:transposase InsO family protein
MLEQEGRHLGLPTLRAEFPDMPRCELGELQAAYRRHYRTTHRRSVERLKWQTAGSVWATDHVVPPNTIDGINRAVLAVRDLASGVELAWQPLPNQTTEVAAAALKSLIDRHGPPLVLKSDNGSAFVGEGFRRMLAEKEITWLPSPPQTPSYNGSCEAANGSMRTRTEHFAERTDGWTAESMEAARRQANELTRPYGHLGPTPSQLWAGHLPIAPQQRTLFLAAVEQCRMEIIADRKEHWNLKNKNHQRQVQRQAVRRALLDCGLLTITRRSISPPLNPKKRDKIS